jgi:hypothetical protein
VSIVLGYDVSPGSRRALAMAVDLAARLDEPLVLVCGAEPPGGPREEFRAQHRALAEMGRTAGDHGPFRHLQISGSLWQPSASSRTSSASDCPARSCGRRSSSIATLRGGHIRRRTAVITAARTAGSVRFPGRPQVSTSERSTQVTGIPPTRRIASCSPPARCSTTPAERRLLRVGPTGT